MTMHPDAMDRIVEAAPWEAARARLQEREGGVVSAPPTPGSDAAVALGCICPVLDNARGVGLPDGSFWMTMGCPVHDPYDTGEDE